MSLSDEQKELIDEMEGLDNQSRYWSTRISDAAIGESKLIDVIRERTRFDRREFARMRPSAPGEDSGDVREDQGTGTGEEQSDIETPLPLPAEQSQGSAEITGT